MSDAATITRALSGKWHANGPSGPYGIVRCLAHDDRSPSLSLRDGERGLLVKCHAGCDARDVLGALRRRGLIEDDDRPNRPTSPTPFAPAPHNPDPEALKIWAAAGPAGGSTVEQAYFPSRRITLAVPPSLRCGSRLHLDRYPMPAMVAAVQRPDGKIVAVQTTLLTAAGCKAPVSTPRLTTGALGAGAVRLAKAGDVLGIAEGVESALSAMQLTGVPCWACLGAGRMHRVAVFDTVRELHIFADNDEPGRAAAERLAHVHLHRRVVLRYPPDGCKDWNDVVVARGSAAA